jgi:pimeloyl-ACP methyl ester carboxylesterase/predicted glycosyltransferase
MRARQPDLAGAVVRDGVRIAYEVHGTGPSTIVLFPTWAVVDSRHWKAQVPYLARHMRVITCDPPGNGGSDRPTDERAYADRAIVEDVMAVMDATETEAAIFAGVSCGARYALSAAASYPERARGLVAICPAIPHLSPPHPWRTRYRFDEEPPTDEGWAKSTRDYWLRDWRGYLEFFFSECLSEPHSTKQTEDCISWGLQTSPEVMLLTECEIGIDGPADAEALCRAVRCPVLVIHGDEDAVQPIARGERLAELTGGSFVVIEGGGHLPQARDPVRINALMREFAESLDPPRPRRTRWPRGRGRSRRALMISSPIGLGHARRDIAIAQELRRLHPELQIDWLAQSPLTTALVTAGERIHPASRDLASESEHLEGEAGPHELDVFSSIRRMDEILVANYMVFRDLVREEPYDLWIADEAWEVDYFLHENPEDKRAAYVWLTDFVGWMPLPDGGEREALLTADYNAEMLEQIDRYPRLRDRSIFVGDPEDVVPADFGPGLPAIREWTEARFDFVGHITGNGVPHEREALRGELGFRPEETVVLVSVGGSGVGRSLLEAATACAGPASERIAGLRMIAVSGPRIATGSVRTPRGVEVRGYVPDLDRHLAASDAAIVQGGLTTTMELVAAGRPFLSFPLRRHFEQRTHVRHRLERHGHMQSLEFGALDADGLAAALADAIAAPPSYLPVPSDGATRAAALISELL